MDILRDWFGFKLVAGELIVKWVGFFKSDFFPYWLLIDLSLVFFGTAGN